MSSKSLKITGWVLTLALAVLFTMSAFMKLTQNEAAIAQAANYGIDATTYQFVGIIEISSLLLFLVPRTGVLGALLLMSYMVGAIVTHLQHQESVILPMVVQISLSVTAFLRFPELRVRLISPQNAH